MGRRLADLARNPSVSCNAAHQMTWEDGTIRSMGPCGGKAIYLFESYPAEGSTLTAEHLNVCDQFRAQYGVSLLENPEGLMPATFTSLSELAETVSGNTDPEGGATP